MKKKELDALLKKFTPKAYELAFNLVPDDLQASQIVVDAATSFVITEVEWLFTLDAENLTKNEELELKKDFYLFFMKHVFSLGMKRFTQLPGISREEEKTEPFFALDGKTRALIYLKYKENMGLSELEQMSGLARSEVMSRLFQGMELLGAKPAADLNQDLPPELPTELGSF